MPDPDPASPVRGDLASRSTNERISSFRLLPKSFVGLNQQKNLPRPRQAF
ncbi:hypothetical protein BH23BAC3_BH23BAC3_27840 [soil metagenome]